jgi:hypothetical protein
LRIVAHPLRGVAALLLTAASAHAGDAYESWPELQFHKWFNDRQSRLIFMTSVSRNRDSGSSYQAEAGLTVEHRFTDWFRGRVGYRHANATDGGPFQENRLLTEQTFHLPIGLGFSVDFRTREDFRWLDTGFFMRLRERMQVQRDVTIGHYVFTPYASAEVYFDTRYNQMSRYRLQAGVSLPVAGHFQVEPYLVRQVDTVGGFTVTHAIGLVLTTSF